MFMLMLRRRRAVYFTSALFSLASEKNAQPTKETADWRRRMCMDNDAERSVLDGYKIREAFGMTDRWMRR